MLNGESKLPFYLRDPRAAKQIGYEREPSGRRVSGEFEMDAGSKHSTSSSEPAQTSKHPPSSQPTLKARTRQLKEIKFGDDRTSITTQKKIYEPKMSTSSSTSEPIAQQKRDIHTTNAKDDASLPAPKGNGKPRTFSTSVREREARITQRKDNLQALYHPDPAGTIRRAELIAEHDAKAKESSLRCGEEIKAAKPKNLSYVKELGDQLEKDLCELDGEFASKEQDRQRFKFALGDLNVSSPY